MSNLKNKLMEKKGTALVTAMAVMALLIIMSTCLAFAIPHSYQVDETTRKMEQGAIFAKAGLNMTINEIVFNSMDEDLKNSFLKKLGEGDGVVKGSFDASTLQYFKTESGVRVNCTADEVNCPAIVNDENYIPEFTVGFKFLNGDEILKVTSTVVYQGVTCTASRYLYYTAGTTSVFPEDAISCSEEVNVLTSIDGRIRANKVNLGGGGSYMSVYTIDTFVTNQSKTAFARSNSGIVGQEGNVYSSKNIIAGSLNMGDESQLSGNGFGSDPTLPGGTLAAGGYIRKDGWGDMVAHPLAIVAHGRELYNAVSLSSTMKDYAIYFDAGDFKYIGDPDLCTIEGYANDEDHIPVAVYSKGNCRLNATGIVIYGNVFIDGDFEIGQWGKITVYGNVYVTGSIIKTNEWAEQLEVKKLPYQGENGEDLGGKIQSNLDASAFALLTSKCKIVSYEDIKSEVGGRNLNAAKIKTYPMRDINGLFTPGDGITEKAGEVLIHITDDCEISGDIASLTANDENGTGWENGRAGTVKDIALFLDASGKGEDENLNVVISGDWFFGGANTGANGYARRLFINDNDGKSNVRLFLRKGTNLYLTCPQLYVPNSAVPSMTIDQILTDGGDSLCNQKIPRFFVFADGGVDESGELIDRSEGVMAHINVSSNVQFRGFILTPLSAVNIDGTRADTVKGKVAAGLFNNDVANAKALTYIRPLSTDIKHANGDPIEDDEEPVNYEEQAIQGVFDNDGSSSGGSGGKFSLTR